MPSVCKYHCHSELRAMRGKSPNALAGRVTLGTQPVPLMCKWNAFTIDRKLGVWEYGEHRKAGKVFPIA